MLAHLSKKKYFSRRCLITTATFNSKEVITVVQAQYTNVPDISVVPSGICAIDQTCLVNWFWLVFACWSLQRKKIPSSSSHFSVFSDASNLRYLQGGSGSGFNHVIDKYENWKPRLFQCKGKRNVRCSQVPVLFSQNENKPSGILAAKNFLLQE